MPEGEGAGTSFGSVLGQMREGGYSLEQEYLTEYNIMGYNVQAKEVERKRTQQCLEQQLCLQLSTLYFK